jgi:DNA-binding MarR family transcriptional regulator
VTAERLFDQLLEASLLLQSDMDRSLSELGLTVTKTHLLWQVHGHGPSTQQRLATEIGVSPRHVTGLVDALEAAGFVHRRPHPARPPGGPDRADQTGEGDHVADAAAAPPHR